MEEKKEKLKIKKLKERIVKKKKKKKKKEEIKRWKGRERERDNTFNKELSNNGFQKPFWNLSEELEKAK